MKKFPKTIPCECGKLANRDDLSAFPDVLVCYWCEHCGRGDEILRSTRLTNQYQAIHDFLKFQTKPLPVIIVDEHSV
jgi:hypothetical protein